MRCESELQNLQGKEMERERERETRYRARRFVLTGNQRRAEILKSILGHSCLGGSIKHRGFPSFLQSNLFKMKSHRTINA